MPSRKESHPVKPYRIVLPDSGDWSLHDLYVFPHAYEQCYAFVYCLDTALPARDVERIDSAFQNYPWKGGYSYVNFYNILLTRIPMKERAKVKSFHKASPGWIDLALNLDAAVQLAKSVAIIAGSGAATAAAYAKAWKLLANLKAEREKARLREVQLTRDQIKAIRGSCDELAKAMGFKSLADLHRRTGDPEVSLKLLNAHYRRMRTLVEYQTKSRAVLPPKNDG